jgi:hypothetical protein
MVTRAATDKKTKFASKSQNLTPQATYSGCESRCHSGFAADRKHTCNCAKEAKNWEPETIREESREIMTSERHEDQRPAAPNPARDEELLPPGEPASSSQGLGKVWGDAERTAPDEPVKEPNARDAAAIEDLEENYTVYEDEDGERYIEEDRKEP